ncbi:element excision factor XisI family protein [Scytonema sp. NUACC26]|uniref:element excision factor XisI family protein n=1 Tax=Scytonema sp. NUACC26 TaxID=3140176 RepID=UPI0034DBC02C
MERIEYYRQCIRNLLSEQASTENSNPDVGCQLVFDTEHDRYQKKSEKEFKPSR